MLDVDLFLFLISQPLPEEKESLIEVLAEVFSRLGVGRVVGAARLVNREPNDGLAVTTLDVLGGSTSTCRLAFHRSLSSSTLAFASRAMIIKVQLNVQCLF